MSRSIRSMKGHRVIGSYGSLVRRATPTRLPDPLSTIHDSQSDITFPSIIRSLDHPMTRSPDQPITPDNRRPRVVLMASPATYRAGAFRQAAARLDLDVVQATDTPEVLAERWGMPLGLDFTKPDAAIAALTAYAAAHPVDAILALDDSATLLAARAAAALGLPHNDPDAALAARDKWVMREALRRGGVPVPEYRRYPLATDPAMVAGEIPFPVVVKPPAALRQPWGDPR